MKRILILSDLHTEFAPFTPPPADFDIAVLAGDIGLHFQGLAQARRWWPNRPIIAVAGNHAFYGHCFESFAADLRTYARLHEVSFLEREAVTVDGVEFLGATLWTDLALHGRPRAAAEVLRRRMMDYRRIQREDGEPLLPTDTARDHRTSVAWLRARLTPPATGPRVVVTHHAPSPRSLPPHWASHELAPGYASDLSPLIHEVGPDLWLHGHIHFPADYVLGRTRVVCNPRGYPGETPEGFDPARVIELAPKAPLALSAVEGFHGT